MLQGFSERSMFDVQVFFCNFRLLNLLVEAQGPGVILWSDQMTIALAMSSPTRLLKSAGSSILPPSLITAMSKMSRQ